MLPAQKRETSPANATASPAGGFGKVLNSIQGLQQRLDDFSVEDVSRAQGKAENLIRELSLLQLKLNALSITEQVVSDVCRKINEIADPNLEPVDVDSLEKYPTLHVLLKASTLVDLVRARAQSLAKYIDELTAVRESAEAIIVNSEPQGSKTPTSSFSQLEASATVEAGGVQETNAESLVTTGKLDELPTQKPGSEKRNQHSPKVSLLDQPQNTTDKKKPTISAKSDFNQRLLDDLIDTYGDFASSPHLAASRKAPKAMTLKTSEFEPATVHLEKLEVSLSATLPEVFRVATASPVLAKITPVEIIPPLELEPRQPTEDNVRNSTKQGEIDRQLKNIIKDYGEYDLYQRHSSVNVKVVGILAFAFLLLVLGGLYFFKSSTPLGSVPANSPEQSNVKSPSGLADDGPGTNSAAARRASSRDATSKPGAEDTLSGAVINTKQKK